MFLKTNFSRQFPKILIKINLIFLPTYSRKIKKRGSLFRSRFANPKKEKEKKDKDKDSEKVKKSRSKSQDWDAKKLDKPDEKPEKEKKKKKEGRGLKKKSHSVSGPSPALTAAKNVAKAGKLIGSHR